MAANIVLTSVIVAADGKTITATISGGSGTGYTVNDKNGFSAQLGNNGPGFPVKTATVSGTTLTVVLYTPFGTGEVVTLEVLTTLLLDTLSNTTAVVSASPGQSCTNNSTVVVKTLNHYDTEAIAGIEAFTSESTSVSDFIRATCVDQPPWDYSIEFVVNATDVSFYGYVAEDTQASIDGGSNFIVPKNSFWTYKPLLSAGSTGDHLIRQEVASGPSYNGKYRISGGTRAIKSVASFKCSAGVPSDATSIARSSLRYLTNQEYVHSEGTVVSPALEGVIDHTGIGGQVFETILDGTILELIGVMYAEIATYINPSSGAPAGRLKNASLANTNGPQEVVGGLNPDGGPFKLRIITIGWSQNSGTRAWRALRGTHLTAATTVGATQFSVSDTRYLAIGDWIRIDQPSVSRRECRQINNIVGNLITLNSALSIAHPTNMSVVSYSAPRASLTSWTWKTKHKRMFCLGDSNTQGANDYASAGIDLIGPTGDYYGWYDMRTTGLWRACQALGIEAANVAVQGETSGNGLTRKDQITTHGRSSVDFVWVWYGTNDINSNVYTPTEYQANIQSIVTTVLPYLRPGGKIILVPPYAFVGQVSAKGLSRATVTTALQTIAGANPTKIEVWDRLFDNLNSTADTVGVHYHQAGQDKLRQNIMAKLSGINSAGFFVS